MNYFYIYLMSPMWRTNFTSRGVTVSWTPTSSVNCTTYLGGISWKNQFANEDNVYWNNHCNIKCGTSSPAQRLSLKISLSSPMKPLRFDRAIIFVFNA